MAINFPTSLDTTAQPSAGQVVDSARIAKLIQMVEALEAKVGVDNSAVSTALDLRTRFVAPAYLRKANQPCTIDPATTALTGSNLTSQVLFVTCFTAAASITTTQVRYNVTTAAAVSNAGTSIGLYSMDASDNGTLIASIVSTSLFTSTGSITQTWAASTAITAGSRYAVAFLNVANSGTPAVCASIPGSPGANLEFAVVPRITGQRTGQSAQGNFTVGQLVVSNPIFFAVII